MRPQLLWHSPHLLPLAAALGVLVVVAVLWLYRSQVRELSWPARWGLPLLRVVALLLLVVSLLRPAVIRQRTHEERGALLVLIDRSRSMSVTDNTRTPPQLVALADALGRLPDGARSTPGADLAAELERVDGLAEQLLAAQADLQYARVSGRGVEDAQERVGESHARLAAALEALGRRSTTAPADADTGAKLAAVATTAMGAADVGDWVASLRTRLREAGDAELAAQAAA